MRFLIIYAGANPEPTAIVEADSEDEAREVANKADIPLYNKHLVRIDNIPKISAGDRD